MIGIYTALLDRMLHSVLKKFNNFNIIVLILLSLVSLFCHFGPLHAQVHEKIPTIVIVNDVPEFGIEQAKLTKSFYEKSLPHYEIVILDTVDRDSLDLKIQFEQQTTKQHEVTHLVLNSHTNSDNNRTIFKFFGEIKNNGPDEKFKNYFEFLVGRFSKNPHIVLDGCKTLCGDVEYISKRVESLFKFLKIKSGSVYGYNTNKYYLSNSGLKSDLPIYTWLPLSVVALVPTLLTDIPKTISFFEMYVGYLASFGIGLYTIEKAASLIVSFYVRVKSNGKFISINQQKVTNIFKARVYKKFKQAYGVKSFSPYCKSLF